MLCFLCNLVIWCNSNTTFAEIEQHYDKIIIMLIALHGALPLEPNTKSKPIKRKTIVSFTSTGSNCLQSSSELLNQPLTSRRDKVESNPKQHDSKPMNPCYCLIRQNQPDPVRQSSDRKDTDECYRGHRCLLNQRINDRM
jgi:hypothetical protein